MKDLPKFRASVGYEQAFMSWLVRLSLRAQDGSSITRQADISDELLQSTRQSVPVVAKELVTSLLRDPRFLPALEAMLTDAMTDLITDQVYRDDWD